MVISDINSRYSGAIFEFFNEPSNSSKFRVVILIFPRYRIFWPMFIIFNAIVYAAFIGLVITFARLEVLAGE